MSPAHVAEPTYEAIRNRLISGTWPMGYRLESARLADDLGVSITPVRDCLNRLVGEKLVDLVPGIGFHVPRLTERMVRDLLDLNLLLLLSAAGTGVMLDSLSGEAATDERHAFRTDALFAQIASLSGNAEVVAAVRIVGARLGVTRVRETAVLSDAVAEVDLIGIAASSLHGDLAWSLINYHEVRKRHSGRLLEPGPA